jgi:ubiquinone/menaquinone biosynthesis C-methylase UbiE
VGVVHADRHVHHAGRRPPRQVRGHRRRRDGARRGHGTGVVAITAALAGARVEALDLTPELLAEARANAAIVQRADIVWTEGDAEQLPYGDASFDVVLSQFGHMFTPRPDVAIAEMRRVLKPNGRIAFATWPP